MPQANGRWQLAGGRWQLDVAFRQPATLWWFVVLATARRRNESKRKEGEGKREKEKAARLLQVRTQGIQAFFPLCSTPANIAQRASHCMVPINLKVPMATGDKRIGLVDPAEKDARR